VASFPLWLAGRSAPQAMSEVAVGDVLLADATKEEKVDDDDTVDVVSGARVALAAVDKVLARAGNNTNWLSLIGAGLTSVPPKICVAEFPFLTQLYLGHNKLTVIPDAVFELLSLRGLFLQNNQIARVSPKINQLAELQELFLCSNVLTCLPPLRSLAALDCLWLDDNVYLPSMLTRNISRNKDSVQVRIASFSLPNSQSIQSLSPFSVSWVRSAIFSANAARTVVARSCFSCASRRRQSRRSCRCRRR
jgi:hypothetical protein